MAQIPLLPDDNPAAFSTAARELEAALADSLAAHRRLLDARGVAGARRGYVIDESGMRDATPEDVARFLDEQRAADARALAARLALTRAYSASEARTQPEQPKGRCDSCGDVTAFTECVVCGDALCAECRIPHQREEKAANG